MTRKIAYNGCNRWIEVFNIRGEAIPIADTGGVVEPQAGDALINGLSRPGWRSALEEAGFTVVVNPAMDSRWSAARIK